MWTTQSSKKHFFNYIDYMPLELNMKWNELNSNSIEKTEMQISSSIWCWKKKKKFENTPFHALLLGNSLNNSNLELSQAHPIFSNYEESGSKLSKEVEMWRDLFKNQNLSLFIKHLWQNIPLGHWGRGVGVFIVM